MRENLLFESIKRSLTGKDKGGNPFDLGFDCGLNGASTTNCSFSIFSCKEATQAWERGLAAGVKKRSELSPQSTDNSTPLTRRSPKISESGSSPEAGE